MVRGRVPLETLTPQKTSWPLRVLDAGRCVNDAHTGVGFLVTCPEKVPPGTLRAESLRRPGSHYVSWIKAVASTTLIPETLAAQ